LISLQDVARVSKWAKRLHRVLRDLDPAVAEYKGLARYRSMAVDWLAPFDDGANLMVGTAPDQDSLPK
jgi:hypothetical protein